MLIVGNGAGLAELLVNALSELHARPVMIVPAAFGDQTMRELAPDRYAVDVSSAAAVRDLHGRLCHGAEVGMGAIVNLLPLESRPFDQWNGGEPPLAVCQATLNLVQVFADDLVKASPTGSGQFLNVTRLDGRFGLISPAANLAGAGTIGMAKTLRREYPSLRVRTIDFDAAADTRQLAQHLVDELLTDDEQVEAGWHDGRRWTVELQSAPQLPVLPFPIRSDSVILVTGGAYGVAAAVVSALASAVRPKLVLVGRSPLPGPEPAETRGLDGQRLRDRLIQLARERRLAQSPAEIEDSFRQIGRDRAIRNTLERCTLAGSPVEYHALDVRDATAFARLIDEVYDRHGRIDGVVHAAGVLHDRRIRNKTSEEFADTFRTKVDGALTLARVLRPDTLKFLVFFSSVSARFGNLGQVDYSAANEFLNKLANHLQAQWPCPVLSINWGPWDGGMVSDTLQRVYTANGVQLIPVAEGVAHLLSELRQPRRTSAEIVITRSAERMRRAAPGEMSL